MAYAGELRPTEAWELLKAEQAAQLVDVRTRPEWGFVGIPDLDSIGKKPILLAWQAYPAMQINQRSLSSGASRRPAIVGRALRRGGYRRCYNVAEGFEGQVDAEGHRGRKAGWKAAGLPWNQD
jgi:rhodanese-related sulfurtransferase